MTTKPATQTNTQPRTNVFEISDTIINSDYGSIADPEFSPIKDPSAATCWMAFRQGSSICVAEINRENGLILSEPQLITNQAAGFVRSGGQGPEWGFNEDEGLLIAYTVVDRGRRGQIKYSRPEASVSGWSAPLDLTAHEGTLVGRIGASASKHGKHSTQVVYREWNIAAKHQQQLVGPQQFFWMDVHEKKEKPLPQGILTPSQPPQFAYPRTETDDNRISDLIFSYRKTPEQPYQIVRYDSSTPGLSDEERIHYLTSVEVDNGEIWDHTDPCCFKAPEYGGQTTYAASLVETVSDSEENPHPSPQRIAIYTQSSYEDDNAAFQSLTRQAVLEIPADAQGYKVISSVEPITTEKASFLSVLLLNPDTRQTSIWLWRLDGKWHRKVSSDDLTGLAPQKRHGSDPENLLGKNELYVYYTVYGASDRQDPTDARVDLHLCKTGVRADGSDMFPTEQTN
ncbi:MAG: hypothetical protein JOZ52_03560 [Acidobacteria bacterium]|nr:hypothetical protein [Acidobacteriota bacterium]